MNALSITTLAVLENLEGTVAQKCHGNFNLFTAISICSRQFQFVHGNFNLFTAISTLLTAISTCSRQFQFAHGHFNLLTAISIFNSNAHGIFRFDHHLSTSAADSGHQKSKRKFKSRCLKSILAYFIMAILFFRKCIKYLGVVIKLEISHRICLFFQFT